MAEIKVWAPRAGRVELEIEGKRGGMRRGGDGWWRGEGGAGGGARYGFYVDGEGPYPDPRSAWQPEGVEGLSRVVEHGRFRWSDAGFRGRGLGSAIIYELHVGAFTAEGTLEAAAGKLEHLERLGVTHVELMPVNAFPGRRGWGYDGVGLYAVHEAYGGPEGLKRFVDAAHGRGLGVLLDVVYNHLGPWGNYLEKFGPYFHASCRTPWGRALNWSGPESDEVRRFFCDNALMWLRDYHMDGLRLDAVHAIVDTSARHFLEQLHDEVAQLQAELGRHLVLIAESDLNDPRVVWGRERGGYGLEAQWSDDLHHALHAVLTGEVSGYYEDFGSVADVAKALGNGYVYEGQYSRHRRRRHGRRPVGVSGHRFVGYAQTHDQVGNRARGERVAQLAGAARAKLGAAVVLTSAFVPMLFMGEGWAASSPFLYFTDHPDEALGKAVTEGRRAEFAAFGWRAQEVPDPQAPETFAASKLEWGELSDTLAPGPVGSVCAVPGERGRGEGKSAGPPHGPNPHRDMLEWYRQLIQLRRREPALSDGRLDLVRTRFDEGGRWLVVERGALTVACNFGDREQRIPVGPGPQKVLLASELAGGAEDGAVMVGAGGVAILKAQEK
jgi:maltooligosyltrehalose trehalohydrolase